MKELIELLLRIQEKIGNKCKVSVSVVGGQFPYLEFRVTWPEDQWTFQISMSSTRANDDDIEEYIIQTAKNAYDHRKIRPE